MDSTFNIKENQITFSNQLINQFYLGVAITLFYAFASPYLVARGYPGLTALLMAEVLVLTPIGLTHLFHSGNKLNGSYSLKNVILFRKKLSTKTMVLWSVGGIVAVFALYIPSYPLGLYLRGSIFSWLPEWYFNPGFGTSDTALVARLFLIGILVDGIIGPVIEELFFRGYLLPRMSYLKQWAPIVNGGLFGLYHLWQPHNFIGLIGVGIVLSYVVWKKQNVYLGIIIHCTINILGAIGGYLAATNGVIIGR